MMSNSCCKHSSLVFFRTVVRSVHKSKERTELFGSYRYMEMFPYADNLFGKEYEHKCIFSLQISFICSFCFKSDKTNFGFCLGLCFSLSDMTDGRKFFLYSMFLRTCGNVFLQNCVCIYTESGPA